MNIVNIANIDFTLIDTDGKYHNLIALLRGQSVRVVFPFPAASGDESPNSEIIDLKAVGEITNILGFITDRMHRLSAYNPNFDSIIIGERKHKLDSNYKELKKLRDVVLIDGKELGEEHTVCFAIKDGEDRVLSETILNYYEVLEMAIGKTEVNPILSNNTLRAGKLPKELDENGNPKLTKNPRINRILRENCFFNEDYKEFAKILSNHLDKVLTLAGLCKAKELKVISMKLFDTQFITTDEHSLCKRNIALIEAGNTGRTITVDSILSKNK